ncbi:hypothetical protein D3C71_1932880 [compost metagenome]
MHRLVEITHQMDKHAHCQFLLICGTLRIFQYGYHLRDFIVNIGPLFSIQEVKNTLLIHIARKIYKMPVIQIIERCIRFDKITPITGHSQAFCS